MTEMADGQEFPEKRACPWCHTMVEQPCLTERECKTCPEPYTLTAEQAAQIRAIEAQRVPRVAKPLPIEDD